MTLFTGKNSGVRADSMRGIWPAVLLNLKTFKRIPCRHYAIVLGVDVAHEARTRSILRLDFD